MKYAFWLLIFTGFCKCSWEILTTNDWSPIRSSGVKIGHMPYKVIDASENRKLVLESHVFENGWIQFPFFVPGFPQSQWVWKEIPEEFFYNDGAIYLFGLLMGTDANNGIMVVLSSIIYFFEAYLNGLYGFDQPETLILFLRTGLILFSPTVKRLLVMWAHDRLKKIQIGRYLADGEPIPSFETDKLSFLAYHIVDILETPFW